MGNGQVWATNSLGGFMYSDNLSKELRMAVQPLCKFRQFCDVKDAAMQGKSKGDTFHWNVYSDIATQGTKLTETTTMPESNFTITQGTLTITEFGNSVPYTGKLDDLSLHPVKEIINKVLKNDARKAFDIAAHGQFNSTLTSFAPYAGTDTNVITLSTGGTCTTTNTLTLYKTHVRAIVDTMKERNVPPYTGDDYYCISHPSTFSDFKGQLESIHQYTGEGFRMIANGEMGRFENCRFVEQTLIPKGGAADSTTWDANTGTADAWNTAKSSWAFFFGEDTVAEAIAVPEEIRGKIPTDYGRSKGIAWYYLGGFGIIHSSAAAQSRIFKWDSAV
jgi:N4-gp56 family major capsid protein